MQDRLRFDRRPRRLVRLGAVALVAATLGMRAMPVAADNGFHQYSHAWEVSLGSYTEFDEQRYDAAVSNQQQSGCGSVLSGDPVYQPMWFHLPPGSNAQFLELGTGHQCRDTYNYWYWGYQDPNGVWHLLGYLYRGNYHGYHTFEIQARLKTDGYYYWNWLVDNVVYYNGMRLGGIGNNLDTGLESYSSTAALSAQALYLEYQRSFGNAYTSWSGADGSQVNTGFCGHWAGSNNNAWAYGEHVSSC